MHRLETYVRKRPRVVGQNDTHGQLLTNISAKMIVYNPCSGRFERELFQETEESRKVAATWAVVIPGSDSEPDWFTHASNRKS